MFAHRLPRLLFVVLALAFSVNALRADYRGAIVIDAANGSVLHEENADAASPPASVTKLMTFLVAHDAIAAGRIRLDTPVTANAADQAMGGTQVFLAAGETFTVEELLFAVMIESANDAAHALAIPVAGSREAFVAAMNARAKSLGMRNTVFRTPHGLPPSTRDSADGDLTTPRDLSLLARELVTKTDVLRYSSVRARLFGAGVRAQPQPMRNHNKLITTVEGCDGLKTGFTRAAGFCLVATAQRGTKRVIVAVMGSPDAKTRDAHVKRLVEEGFAKIPADSVFSGAPVPLTPVGVTPLPGGATPVTPVTPVAPGASGASSSAPQPEAAEEDATVRFVLPKR